MCDGTGRDVYLTGQMPTGSVPSTAPPPRPFIRAAPPRTVTVPKYRPSGTGRDTFHGVDLTEPKGEFKLRDYEVKGMGLRYDGSSIDAWTYTWCTHAIHTCDPHDTGPCAVYR